MHRSLLKVRLLPPKTLNFTRNFLTISPLRDANGTNKAHGSTETTKKQQEFEQKFKESEEEEPETMKKQEKQRIGWAVGLGIFSSYLYLGWGDYSTGTPISEHNRRAWESIVESYEYFMHPPKKALLPPLPKALHRDFTLCVELSDVLTHLVWEVV